MINTENQSFLTFRLGSLKFAVNSVNVREIFYLPELTPVEEVPNYIAGVMNLRGKIIPVLDLNIRFGHPRDRYLLSDRIITVLTEEGDLTGIIVNEVNDVLCIPLTAMEPPPEFVHGKESLTSFISSLSKINEAILMVLNLERLIHFSNVQIAEDRDEAVCSETGERLAFCPWASQDEMAIFKERARELMTEPEVESLSETLHVAVAGISGEYYGITLDAVQEFASIHLVTPIPCCPGHIVGNMNLRGNVLTIVDIRGIFDLPVQDAKAEGKAIVVSKEDIVVGLAVDEIIDIIHIHSSEMVHAPSALNEGKEKYLIGTAPYEGRIMNIINISKVLFEGNLTVNEEI